jgi:hypothetical protein
MTVVGEIPRFNDPGQKYGTVIGWKTGFHECAQSKFPGCGASAANHSVVFHLYQQITEVRQNDASVGDSG